MHNLTVEHSRKMSCTLLIIAYCEKADRMPTRQRVQGNVVRATAGSHVGYGSARVQVQYTYIVIDYRKDYVAPCHTLAGQLSGLNAATIATRNQTVKYHKEWKSNQARG